MKTATDPRHLNRIKAFKAIFAKSFHEANTIENELALVTLTKLDQLNEIIKKCAPEWPLSQINRVDLSVLQLAVYELLYRPEVPTKVIIDEAVEIAKRYGGQNSGSFVNGALAAALKLTDRETPQPDKHEEAKVEEVKAEEVKVEETKVPESPVVENETPNEPAKF